MKPLFRCSFILIGAIVLTGVGFGQDRQNVDPRYTLESLKSIEQNLVIGLQDTEHPGLQASSAQQILDIQGIVPSYPFSSALIPLMAILKNDNAPVTARIYAALALHNLHSQRGDFAIERIAEFTHLPQLQKLCTAMSTEAKS